MQFSAGIVSETNLPFTMKKVFLLFLGTLFSVATMAQNTRVTTRLPQNHNEEGGSVANNRGFGIKGGVNFNHFRGSDTDKLSSFSNETSWHAGFYGQFAVKESNFFSIQTELLYNRRGFKSEELDVRIDNLEVPLLFVFNVLDNVSLHAGPYGGVLITLKEDDAERGEDDRKDLNSFMYGLAAGAEARVSFVRVGARYNLGLNDVYKDADRISLISGKALSDLKSGMFQVYLGVGI